MIPVRFGTAIILAAALCLPPARCGAEDLITASSSSSKAALGLGESTHVVVSVQLAPGWHVNSHEPGIDFLIPTKLDFELPEGIRAHDLMYPEPVSRKLRFAGDRELRVYEGAFTIRATLSYESASATPRELVALLRYQACNDTVCKRPSILRIPIEVRIAATEGVSLPLAAAGAALEWEPFTTHAYDGARRRGTPFVIEFRADWCAPCREMEERTFRDPNVLEAGREMSFLSVDMTEPDDFIERVIRSFQVHAAPTTIFFDSGGKEWHRRGGFIGPDDFAQLLREIGNDEKPSPQGIGDLKPI